MVDGVVLAKGTHCSNACRCAVRSIALLAFLASIESECRDVRTALVDDTTDEGGGPRQTLGSMVRNSGKERCVPFHGQSTSLHWAKILQRLLTGTV